MPETESEADTDLPETQVREDGVYITALFSSIVSSQS